MTIDVSLLWSIIIGVLGATLTVLNIADKIRAAKERKNAPEELQNARIQTLETGIEKIQDTLAQHEIYLKRDKERLDTIESERRVSNKLIIRSLQALTEHAIDGSGEDKLKKVKAELEEYLLNK